MRRLLALVAGATEAATPANPAPEGRTQALELGTAWLLVGLATQLPLVLTQAALGTELEWLVPIQLTLLAGLAVVTRFDARLRPLGAFTAALAVATLQFHVRVSTLERVLGRSIPPGAYTVFAHELLRSGVTALLFVGLLARGYDRDDLRLRWGDLSARADPERLPGFRRSRPWSRLGAVWGALVVAGTAAFLVGSSADTGLDSLATPAAGVLGPVVVIAAFNAVNEELVFRAAPLAGLRRAVGKRHATLLSGAFFGLSHYYGTPGGVPGVALGFFLGWLLAKSLFETRGIAYAVGLHFLLDVLILSALLA